MINSAQRQRQQFIDFPEGSAGKETPFPSADKEERAGIATRKSGMNGEFQFTVFFIETYAQTRVYAVVTNGQRLSIRLLMNRLAYTEIQNIDEIGFGEQQTAFGRTFGNILDHKEQVFITRREPERTIARNRKKRNAAAGVFGVTSQRDFSSHCLVFPSFFECQSQFSRHRIRMCFGHPLDIQRFIDLCETFGTALFPVLFFFTARITELPDGFQTESHEMCTDETALLIVPTGTVVFHQPVRQQFKFRAHPPNTDSKLPGDHRRVVVHLFHHSPLKQNFSVAEGFPSGPLFQNFMRKR